jgi:hypothetical protein
MTEATATARPVGVMVTQGHGPHPPRSWAIRVAYGMVGIDPQMDNERIARAQSLRAQIADILFSAFDALAAMTSNIEVRHLADNALVRIDDALANSEWRFEASSEDIRAEFRRYVLANLTDARNMIQFWG